MLFEVETSEDIRECKLLGFHQEWLTGNDDEINFTLSAGTGLGNPFLQLSIENTKTGEKFYDHFDIRTLVIQWLDNLETR